MKISLRRACRPRPRLISGAAGAVALVLGVPSFARALTITPIFAAGVTAGQQAIVNQAIQFYQTTFSDPITVRISFAADATCGLGCSTTGYTKLSYNTFRTALGADGTSADDATALANTPGGANNPVSNTPNINATTANARAVGINAAGFVTTNCPTNDCDGAVRFNPNNTALAPTAGLFYLLSVIEHEVDEVLGTASDVGGTSFFSDPSVADLYRWNNGVRNFTTACGSYFSLNGGVTNLDPYNCVAGADFGDWQSTGTPQVQDAFGTTGANAFLTSGSVETRLLDVVGYTRAAQTVTPEPSSLFLLGTGLSGLAGIGFRRRRRSDS